MNDYGKSLFKPLLSVQNIVLAIALIFGVSLLNLSSSELASWVQAVGSIAAIWGAFTVSNNQVRQQIDQKKESDKRKAESLFAVVKSAADHFRSLENILREDISPQVFKISWSKAISDVMEMSLNSLKQLPAHELGNRDLVVAHIGITGGAASALELCRRFQLVDALIDAEYQYLISEIKYKCKSIEKYWHEFEIASTK
ncbi:hypothetical protein [Pseudomonas rustica]|uniref:hypothetical protein n=1 Tax=Pseudomonas rustica TaxID=2827099 RepID=UPI001BAEBB08|nr:hypothetical protein [Pseudomonas rustica]MBS4090407.1 hypothetical protein [Pseudomonas rustica]